MIPKPKLSFGVQLMLHNSIGMNKFHISTTLSSLGYFYCGILLFQVGPLGYSVLKRNYSTGMHIDFGNYFYRYTWYNFVKHKVGYLIICFINYCLLKETTTTTKRITTSKSVLVENSVFKLLLGINVTWHPVYWSRCTFDK